jgi:hypothetical protein
MGLLSFFLFVVPAFAFYCYAVFVAKDLDDGCLSVGGPLRKGYIYNKIVFDSHVGMSKHDAMNDPIRIEWIVPNYATNVSVTWTPLNSSSFQLVSASLNKSKLEVVVAFWGYKPILYAGFK